MRETIGDWRRDWLEANGPTTGLEAVIKEASAADFGPALYEGSFVGIPAGLLSRKVCGSWQIAASSEPEREGAYTLTVWGGMERPQAAGTVGGQDAGTMK